MNKLEMVSKKIGDLFENGWFVLALFVALLGLFFSHSLLEGRIPGPFEYLNVWGPWHNPNMAGQGNYVLSDQTDFYVPNVQYVREALKDGEFPLWNSKLAFGTPFFWMTFAGHLYPPNMLALLVPIEYFWFVSACLRMLVLGFFVYKLLRLYKINGAIAALAGMTLMVSHYNIAWVGTAISYSYSAIPFVLYTTTLIIQGTGRVGRLLFVVSLINLLLSSFPSMIFYGLLVVGLYALFLLREKLFTTRRGWSLILLSIVALVMCSIPYFYSSFFITDTVMESRAEWKALMKNDTAQLSQMFYPELFGDHFERFQRLDSSLSPINYLESANYLSIVFVLLNVLHFVYLLSSRTYRRNKLVWFWTAILIWTLMMVYNLGGLIGFFSKLPIFDKNPSTRLLGIFVLAAAVLGAMALNETITNPKQNKYRFLVAMVITLLAALVPIFEYERYVDFSDTERHVITQIAYLVSACVPVVLFLFWKKAHAAAAVPVILVGAVIFANSTDLGNRFNSDYTPETFYPETEIIRFLQENLTADSKIITVGYNVIPHINLFHSISSVQAHWFSTQEQKDFLQQLDADYLEIRATQDFFDPLDLTASNALLDFLNVKYIVTPSESVDSMALGSGEFAAINFPNKLTVIENLRRPYTTEAPPDVCDDDTVYSYAYLDGHISFQTHTCEGKQLVLPVWDYPGWEISHATSPEIRMLADEDFITLDVPPGVQSIELNFEPEYYVWLQLLTLVGLAGAIGLIGSRVLDDEGAIPLGE